MNKYTVIKKCRCCDSELQTVLDLNDQPLANSYHNNKEELDEFPLCLNVCRNCFHLQLSVVVNPDLMFKNYLYVSGTTDTLKKYFDFFARFTIERYKNYFNHRPDSVLDIACNDGTQLDYYNYYGLETFGIDPAENLIDEKNSKHKLICDYFPSERINRKYSLITAQNVFAHTHDIYNFLKSCSNILDDDGILYIQTSQANMISKNEFDTAYHEHVSFFNTLSMKTIVERSGLKLNNVFKFDIHGTSYIFEISKSTYDSNLDSIIKYETEMGLYNLETYKLFSSNAIRITSELKNTILQYRDQGYKIIGYGAAAKGMTLLNFGKINLDYIIDDNPLKHELYTPGRNIMIKPPSFLREISTDEKIVFIPLAWNFFDEINQRIKKERSIESDIFVRYFPDIKIIKNNFHNETLSNIS